MSDFFDFIGNYISHDESWLHLYQCDVSQLRYSNPTDTAGVRLNEADSLLINSPAEEHSVSILGISTWEMSAADS